MILCRSVSANGGGLPTLLIQMFAPQSDQEAMPVTGPSVAMSSRVPSYFSFRCWARRFASNSRLVVLARWSAGVAAESGAVAGREEG